MDGSESVHVMFKCDININVEEGEFFFGFVDFYVFNNCDSFLFMLILLKIMYPI